MSTRFALGGCCQVSVMYVVDQERAGQGNVYAVNQYLQFISGFEILL